MGIIRYYNIQKDLHRQIQENLILNDILKMKETNIFFRHAIFMALLLCSFSCFGCNNSISRNATAETSASFDEIGQKNSSTEFDDDRPTYAKLQQELDSMEIYNDTIIYGYWFEPHAACFHNIFLHKDYTYEFTDPSNNDESGSCKIWRGTFSIEGDVIILHSEEPWFKIYDKSFDGKLYHRSNGTNFYLTDKKEALIYFVKGSD